MNKFKRYLKNKVKNLILWALSDSIQSIGIDQHLKTCSWAVFNVRGERTDYVMFASLKDKDVKELQRIVSEFSKAVGKRDFVNLDPVYPFYDKNIILKQNDL